MSDRGPEPNGFDEGIQRLKYEKVKAELEKVKAETRHATLTWWKRPAYIAAFVPVLLSLFGFLTAWSTGFFSNERAALTTEIDALTDRRDELIEGARQLETQNKHLNVELTSSRAFVDAVDSVTRTGGGLVAWATEGRVAYAVTFEPDIAQLLDITSANRGGLYYDIPSSGNTNVGESLAQLVHIPNIQYVFIDGDAYNVTLSGIRSLESLQSLRGLGLAGGHFDDKSIQVVARLKNLEWLHLDTENVTDEGLAELARLTTLKTFAISSEQITNEGVASLAAMQNLESLLIGSRQVNEDGLRNIVGLSKLRELALAGVFSSAVLQEVGKLTALRRFEIESMEDGNLRPLAQLRSLERLIVKFRLGTRVDGLAVLANFRLLDTLGLQYADITDLSPITNLDSLKVLDVTGCSFPGDEGVEIVNSGPITIEYLSLANTAANDDDLENVTRYVRLKVLLLDYTDITDAALKVIARLPSLKQLGVEGTRVSTEGVREFARVRPDVIVRGEGTEREPVPIAPEAALSPDA